MKYSGILELMSLKEKIALCSGRDFWHTKEFDRYGIPSAAMADGPHGLRKQLKQADSWGIHLSEPATCFPAAVSTACSWDPELLGEIAAAIAEEAAAAGVGLLLGPGLNIKRNPLCGRNFEYFSEDPYLTGKLGAAFVREAEKRGVGTCVKHFACNNKEYMRFTSDSILDERTLREIYLSGFETVVREGSPTAVMSAYNKINSTTCSSSKMLLTDILREEWGFSGAVITDWGAMVDRIEAFRAGCDLCMPGGSGYMEEEAEKAVKESILSERSVDDSAGRVLTLAFDKAFVKAEPFDPTQHHELARKAASHSAVLLKNEEGLLPLKQEAKVCLIGEMAKKIRYQGSGSSHINPLHLVSAADALPHLAHAAGCREDGFTSKTLLKHAAVVAKQSDIAVVFAGLPDRYETEGLDRSHMRMPKGHLRLIREVAKANPRTVVVLLCGSPVETPFLDKVSSVLYLGLPGEAGGEAIADLLYGRVTPCGKLAETWPRRYEDCISSAFFSKHRDAHYREGIYVGYRYYDKAEKKVRFPFGYGLSYTTFLYSDLKVEGNTVRATVKNTGKVPGAEIAQLYIEAPKGGLFRPARELKGFCKVQLQPGEAREITFLLSERCFSVWDKGWKIPAGTYRILVGGGSRDLPLEAFVEKEGSSVTASPRQQGSWYETLQGIPGQAEWEQLLGRPVKPQRHRRGNLQMDTSIGEMKDHSLIIRFLFRNIKKIMMRQAGGRSAAKSHQHKLAVSFVRESTLSGLQITGGLKGHVAQAMLDVANGHYLRGLRVLLKR